MVDWETHFTIFVYRRFEIEILGIVECRAIFRLEAQAGRQARASRHAGWQPGRWGGMGKGKTGCDVMWWGRLVGREIGR